MKILLVNDVGQATYGAPSGTLRLRDGLRQRGHDARVLSTTARPLVRRDVIADYQCFGSASRFQTLVQTANPWAYWQLRRVLKEFQPDVVHVVMFLTQLSPLILSLLKNVPSLHDIVVLRPICPMGTKMLPDGTSCPVTAGAECYRRKCLPLHSFLPQMLELWFYRRWRKAFDLTTTISHAMQRRLMREGVEPQEVVLRAVPTRPLRPTLSPPPTVAFAGRLILEKGADVLIQAFARVLARIPDAQLVIAGDGPQRGNLEEMIAELSIATHVTMTGHLSRPEMERLFDTAWVQVIPSRWEEPFGDVAVEGMMRGTAIVASASGGLAELVQEGSTGMLVPPDDIDAVETVLLRVLRNRELAERLGRAGRDFALAIFSEEAYLDRILQLYNRLVSPQPGEVSA
ncbi:MAG: glycosyltransferase family 4 protein [Deltaproteobacteria bacterium]|nr:glycosyltransferase family 4 protein [Deltaproteobacteria bacterium]